MAALIAAYKNMYDHEIVRQHFVSWFYLKNWRSKLTNGQQGIWAKQGAEAPAFIKGRNKIALSDRFYRVKVDDDVLGMMQYKYAPDLSEGVVDSALRELETLAGVSRYQADQMPDHKRLDIIHTNYLENKYSVLENVIARDLEKLVNSQWQTIWGTPSAGQSMYESFLFFYGIQLFRTRSMHDRLGEEITSFVVERKSGSTVLSEIQKETLLKLITYIESIRFLNRLRRANPLVEIRRAEGRAKFFTSDAPAQCLPPKVDEQKQFVEFYGQMPLSPSHFMTITRNPQTTSRITLASANEPEVDEINRRFVSVNKGADIYAVTKESLVLL